jgi:hypothetical protein
MTDAEQKTILLPGLSAMSMVRKTIAVILSSVCLMLAAWLGFHLAGVIALILFAPLGALAGFLLESMSLADILEFAGSCLMILSL